MGMNNGNMMMGMNPMGNPMGNPMAGMGMPGENMGGMGMPGGNMGGMGMPGVSFHRFLVPSFLCFSISFLNSSALFVCFITIRA